MQHISQGQQLQPECSLEPCRFMAPFTVMYHSDGITPDKTLNGWETMSQWLFSMFDKAPSSWFPGHSSIPSIHEMIGKPWASGFLACFTKPPVHGFLIIQPFPPFIAMCHLNGIIPGKPLNGWETMNWWLCETCYRLEMANWNTVIFSRLTCMVNLNTVNLKFY